MQTHPHALPTVLTVGLLVSAAGFLTVIAVYPPTNAAVRPFVAGPDAALYNPVAPPPSAAPWSTFASEAELRARLAPLSGYPAGGEVWVRDGAALPPSAQQRETSGAALPDFTGTNVQVAGIDEPDSVKTDGTFLYIAGSDSVAVLRAAPARSIALLATINLEGRYANGLFLNGNRLVVIASSYGMVTGRGDVTLGGLMPVYTYSPTTALLIFDVTDPGHPVLADNLSLGGYFVGARMVGSQVVLVASHYLYLDGEVIVLPKAVVDGKVRTVPATAIGYFPEAANASSVTEILIVPLQRPDLANLTTFLADAGSTMYMSHDSMVLVGYGGRFEPAPPRWVDSTTLHRLFLWGGTVTGAVTGEVAGHVVNAYSIDEYGGNLRVATTEWTESRQTANHLFVLDRALEPLGSLDDLAPGETIQSVRFEGERAYIVTFRQVDPFFVIDLRNPRSPAALGELKATGFARFLFPVGESLILGIGPETSAPDETGRVKTLGLKLSLFDVRDVAAPSILSTYTVEGTWVYSAAEYDPHALLWVEARSLLAIPVHVYNYSIERGWDSSTVWQGVMVFTATREGGVARVGTLVHEGTATGPYPVGASPIARTLQVGAYLYTVSQTTVAAHGIDDLKEVAAVDYWSQPVYPFPWAETGGSGGGTVAPPPASGT